MLKEFTGLWSSCSEIKKKDLKISLLFSCVYSACSERMGREIAC